MAPPPQASRRGWTLVGTGLNHIVLPGNEPQGGIEVTITSNRLGIEQGLPTRMSRLVHHEPGSASATTTQTTVAAEDGKHLLRGRDPLPAKGAADPNRFSMAMDGIAHLL